jgi:hypothetical protein
MDRGIGLHRKFVQSFADIRARFSGLAGRRLSRTSGPRKIASLHIKELALVRNDEFCTVNAW